jgi:hypothetical protein
VAENDAVVNAGADAASAAAAAPKKPESSKKQKSPDAKKKPAAPKAVKPPAEGEDSDKVDSVGQPKGDAPVPGPRGVNVPLDSKPRPAEKPVKNTVTDFKDSAGNDQTGHAPPQIGPRGPHAGHVRDTFYVDKHRQ